MRKGISPIVAVVLLIAIAVIAAVGLYFWVGGLATKQPSTSTPGTITAICNAPNILVSNSGASTVDAGTLTITNTNGNALENTTVANACDSVSSLAAGQTCIFSTDAAAGDSGFIFGAQIGQAEFNC